jgi:hypothetical protein
MHVCYRKLYGKSSISWLRERVDRVDPNRRGKVDACVVKYDQVKDIICSTKDRWVQL